MKLICCSVFNVVVNREAKPYTQSFAAPIFKTLISCLIQLCRCSLIALLPPTRVVAPSSLFLRYPDSHIVAPHVASAPLRTQSTSTYSEPALSTLLVSDDTAVAAEKVFTMEGVWCRKLGLAETMMKPRRCGPDLPTNTRHRPGRRCQRIYVYALSTCPGCRFFLRHTHDKRRYHHP
jgi:hypothetical protein